MLLAFMICYKAVFAFTGRYWNSLLYRTGFYGKLHHYLSASCRLMLLLIVILILMYLLGQIQVFVRKRKRLPGALVPGLYMLIMSFLTIVIGFAGAEGFRSRSTIVYSSTYFILVAVTEELVYRGVTSDILLNTFLFRCNPYGSEACSQEGRKAIWIATLCSGFIFGLAHLSNMAHAGTVGVLVQMLGAFLMGMVLVAVYYRTANIYAVIVLHAINDLAAAMQVTILQSNQSISDVISGYGMTEILMLIPYAVVLLVILRPSKLDEIWKQWNREMKGSRSII